MLEPSYLIGYPHIIKGNVELQPAYDSVVTYIDTDFVSQPPAPNPAAIKLENLVWKDSAFDITYNLDGCTVQLSRRGGRVVNVVWVDRGEWLEVFPHADSDNQGPDVPQMGMMVLTGPSGILAVTALTGPTRTRGEHNVEDIDPQLKQWHQQLWDRRLYDEEEARRLEAHFKGKTWEVWHFGELHALSDGMLQLMLHSDLLTLLHPHNIEPVQSHLQFLTSLLLSDVSFHCLCSGLHPVEFPIARRMISMSSAIKFHCQNLTSMCG